MSEHTVENDVWYEVEVRLYQQAHWRKTTALVGGIKDGFPTPEAARDFTTMMREKSGDVLYEDADWRIVRYERRVLPPANGGGSDG